MKILEVVWHLNTPGHPKSQGGIESLHSALSDHLRVYQLEKGLERDEAMERAIAAYNHSIHSVTGFSPFEIIFGLSGRRRNYHDTATEESNIAVNCMARRKIWARVRDKIVKEKRKRVARHNLSVRNLIGNLKIGTVVHRKVGTNRGKEMQRYEGPFRVVTIREHNIVTIEGLKEPKKRRTVHLEQLKLPATAVS
ncbi:uncharacterized protein [Halyomorpha halys]|uniref:uncharacterized protein n=1 Tax=Halyomorpha halys TaxID=286706 RepID=UPI0006D4CACB